MSFSNKDQGSDDIVSDINMTPLIDVMLVLLIIFMVTSSMAIESGLDVVLPQTSQTQAKETKEILVVSLNAVGQIAIAGVKVTKAELKDVLTKKLTEMKTDSIMFEGDISAKLGEAVEIMDMARQAGAKNFSLAADKKPTN